MTGPQPPSGAALLPRMLAAAGTAVYVASVYAVVVVGGGAILDRGPVNVPLAVLATGIVAISLEPVGRYLRRRLVGPAQDPLVRFRDTLGTAVAVDQVGPRMAELLAAATGAARVEVWLLSPGASGRQEELAGRWPVDAGPIDPTVGGVRCDEVRHAGEVIGRLLRDGGDADAGRPVEDRLVSALVAQAGVALRTVLLTNQLQQRVSQSSARADDLRVSRQRIVATADAARRRLERDVHDGAQQHLVGLAVNLSLAATVCPRSPSRAADLINDLHVAALDAVETLEELSRGIYPKVLTGSGVAAALRSAVATSTIPVSVCDETAANGASPDGTGLRFAIEVEAAAYFTCLEAVQNAVKHARPSSVAVRLDFLDGALQLSIQDDGAGFDVRSVSTGVGLGNIRDRIESLGGYLRMVSIPGSGTAVSARILAAPLTDPPQPGRPAGDVTQLVPSEV